MTPPNAPPDTADPAQRDRASAVSSCPAPAARPAGDAANAGDAGDAGHIPTGTSLDVLRKRSEFLAAARARRQGAGSMMVQARRRPAGTTDGETAGRTGRKAGGDTPDPERIRVGFTCSRKVGNAVARNRAKRRLREAARAVLPHHGRPGWDYVLIGRRDATASRPFELLKADLEKALARLHGDAPADRPRGPQDRGRGR